MEMFLHNIIHIIKMKAQMKEKLTKRVIMIVI